MKFKEGLLRARSNIAFMVGLVAASGLVYSLESASGVAGLYRPSIELSKLAPNPVKRGVLSEDDMAAAKIAWRYFENNTQSETGLVNSVNGFASTTLWDQASYILGLVSAYRLGIVGQEEFDIRIVKVLDSMARMELFDGKLPNKVYNTQTLAMTDYTNKVIENGIGWSAIDIARVLVPLNVIVWNFPEHGRKVKAIVEAWDFDAMLKDGAMIGARVSDEGETELVQEGRLGYEEYAARSMNLMGFDSLAALRFDDYLRFINIYDQKIAYDSRSHAEYHAHNYVVSEPYILTAVEFGFDANSRELAWRVYRAQEERYKATGIETAVSEDNVDVAPYFVYNTVFSNGKPWNAIAEDGTDQSHLRTMSTKAVFGWDALYNTRYTNMLRKEVTDLFDPKNGWYSGRQPSPAAVQTPRRAKRSWRSWATTRCRC
ncbi:MAG: DUF3131 domain-containing protein [Acidobacteriota bacterium]